MSADGDWSEWRNHVLKELERQNDNIESLNTKLDELAIKAIKKWKFLPAMKDEKPIVSFTEQTISYK